MNHIYKLFTWTVLALTALFGAFFTGFGVGVITNEDQHKKNELNDKLTS